MPSLPGKAFVTAAARPRAFPAARQEYPRSPDTLDPGIPGLRPFLAPGEGHVFSFDVFGPRHIVVTDLGDHLPAAQD